MVNTALLMSAAGWNIVFMFMLCSLLYKCSSAPINVEKRPLRNRERRMLHEVCQSQEGSQHALVMDDMDTYLFNISIY